MLRKDDLDNAEKNCASAGAAAGAVLTVTGLASGNPAQESLGKATFQYSGVACNSLANAGRNDDLMLFLGPNQIVGAAVRGAAIKDFVNQIPLVSDADKKSINGFVQNASDTVVPQVTVQPEKVEVRGNGYRVEIKRPW